jgi:hypothetical protein
MLLSLAAASGVVAVPRVPATVAQALPASIGAGSCVGASACTGATGNIGANSCNGELACSSSVGNIGDNSCNAFEGCEQAAGSVGDGSCNGTALGGASCFAISGNVGNNACNGVEDCRVATGPIGDNSCLGDHGCDGIVGSVGTDSCNGDSACALATANVGNYSCNGDSVCAAAASAVGDCADNATGLTPAECNQPDAQIRLGGSPYIGNDIYGLDLGSQALSGHGAVGDRLTFGILIENDGLLAGSFTVKRTGHFQDGYRVRYYDAANVDVTGMVNSGKFTTPSLAPGTDYTMRAVVKIRSLATVCSSVTRLITVTSTNDAGVKDAVRFVASLDTPC